MQTAVASRLGDLGLLLLAGRRSCRRGAPSDCRSTYTRTLTKCSTGLGSTHSLDRQRQMQPTETEIVSKDAPEACDRALVNNLPDDPLRVAHSRAPNAIAGWALRASPTSGSSRAYQWSTPFPTTPLSVVIYRDVAIEGLDATHPCSHALHSDQRTHRSTRFLLTDGGVETGGARSRRISLAT